MALDQLTENEILPTPEEFSHNIVVKDNDDDTTVKLLKLSDHTGDDDDEDDEDTEEVDEDQLPLALDQGYAWVIMIASLFNNFIVDGIANSYAEMLVDFSEYFDAPKSSITLIGSLLCGVYLLTGPFAGGLVNKFGCRPVCMVGAVISSVAFFLSSFSKSVFTLTLTYGVLGGIGFGLVYLPSIVSVNFYFQKRRSLALGLAVCGTGIGTFVMGPVCKFLLMHYGWQNTMIILSGFALNCAVFGALMMPIQTAEPENETDEKGTSNGGDKKVTKLVEKYLANMRKHTASTQSDRERVSESNDKSADFLDISGSAPNDLLNYSQSLSLDERLRTASDTRALRKRNGSSGPNYIKSTPHLGSTLKLRPRNATTSHYTKHVSPAKLHDIRRPLYQKDIFLSQSIFDLRKDSKIRQSKQDMSLGNLYISMTRLPTPRIQQTETGDEVEVEQGWKALKPIKYALQLMTNFALLKEPSFMIIWIANLVSMIAFYVPTFFISDYAKDQGVDMSLTCYFISSYGILNTIGRVLFGFLAGLPKMSALLINNVTIALTGVTVLLLPLCTNFVSICIVFSLYGLFSAPMITLTSVILCRLVGLDNLTNAFGLLILSRGITSCIGAPIVGYLYNDQTKYLLPFIAGGVLFIACAGLHFLLHIPRFQQQVEENEENTDNIVKSLQKV